MGGFLCAESEISPQTQENISNWRSVVERRHISQDLTDRFSLNFPYSYMAMGRIFCASLDDFLCAKSEISPQTQENWRSVAERRRISRDLTGGGGGSCLFLSVFVRSILSVFREYGTERTKTDKTDKNGNG